MGLIGCLLGAVSYPGPLVLIPPEHFLARPALWLRAVARHRGTISAAPHFAYAYAADRVRDADLAGLSLASWRIALDGAEPVTTGALRRFADRFAPFGLDPGALMPVYGLSEAALAVTFSPSGRPPLAERIDPASLRSGRVTPGEREVVSVGVPIPGVEVEVRGEDGGALPERRLGRIHVRGPSLMQGYLGDPAATSRALRDGWLDTGDLGFHAGGELFVHGRAKDVVIVRGANHAPEEFEACLGAVEGLRPGCAVAVGFVPEGGDGEELLLLVERTRAWRGDPDGARRGGARGGLVADRRASPHGADPRARDPAAHLQRQDAPRRGAAPLPGGEAPSSTQGECPLAACGRCWPASSPGPGRGGDVRDVIVIGGGPAGLAAAAAVAARGLDALLLERRELPADKACGEGLLPGGVRALEALGAAAPPRPGRLVPAARHPLDPGGRALRRGAPAGAGRDGDPQAGALGGARRPGARGRGRGPRRGRGGVAPARRRTARRSASPSGEELRARVLVAADGLGSAVREREGLVAAGGRAPPLRPAAPLRDRPLDRRGRGPLLARRRGLRHPGGSAAGGARLPLRGGDRARLRRPPGALPGARLPPRRGALRLGAGRSGPPRAERVGPRPAAGWSSPGTPAATSTPSPGRGCRSRSQEAVLLGELLPEALSRGATREALLPWDRAVRARHLRHAAVTRLVLGMARRPALRRTAVALLGRAPRLFDALVAGAVG